MLRYITLRDVTLYFSLDCPLQNKDFSSLHQGVWFSYLDESEKAIFKVIFIWQAI